MLKARAVEDLRHSWNERASSMFVEAEVVTDAEVKARLRGKAEAYTLCAQELRAADQKEG